MFSAYFAYCLPGYLQFSPHSVKVNVKSLDKSHIYINQTSDAEYAHKVIDWDLKNKILTNTELPAYEYIKYGKLFASVLQEELAFQCFYMSHLKDHKNIKTNSELQFDTYNTNIIDNSVDNS
jgi:hypothetical protein